MKGKMFLFSLLCLNSLLFANQDEQQAMINQALIDLSKPENLEEFRKMRENKNLVEEEFLYLRDLEISSDSEILKLKDTNFLVVHPEFPKTVIFTDAKITDLTAYPNGSISAQIDNFNLNTIELKITNSFKKGAVVVKYLDKQNRKKVTNLMIETYDIKRGKQLYLTSILKDYNQIKPLEIVKSYQKLHKQNPKHNSSIVINGEAYRFIEDRVNGFVTIGDKKFRIEHNFK